MARFIDIGQINTYIAKTPLEELPIFLVDAENVSTLAMMALHKTAEIRMGRHKAKDLMRLVIDELTKARMLGELDACPATSFTLPAPRLTISDLRLIFERFEPMERKLLAFCLLTRMSPTEASFFQHKHFKIEANINKWGQEIRDLVRGVPRNLFCEYLFWQTNSSGRPVPLINFESRFRTATKCSWQVFLGLCDDMIALDPVRDGEELSELIRHSVASSSGSLESV